MRIAFFIGQLGQGGAENVVATLTSQLAQRGHNITLVSHLKTQFYDIANEVNLIDVRSWQYDTYVGLSPVRLCKKAANRFKDFINIRRIIKQEKPEVVISFLCGWIHPLVLLCKGHIPLICAERNAMVYPHGRQDFLNKQIMYRLAYGVQVMSRHDKAWLRNRYKRVYPMPNPLRFEPLSKKEYDDLFQNRKNILACGRVHSQKGFEKLIEAFSLIASDFPEWSVDICGNIGDENYYQSLLNRINYYGLKDRVVFLGVRKDVNSLMQSHSIFCLSSQHEGFPNVLSEAMANGMACVSFDIVTGPSEIIVDGIDGFVVEDQNVEELARGLSMLMGNEDLRYTVGACAIGNITRYSKDKIVAKWENMFKNIINNYYGKNKNNMVKP